MASYEIVLRGGTVIDGTGAAPVRADVAIEAERIAAIGQLAAGAGRRELDVSDLTIAPGFIDVHTHDDRALLVSDMSAKVSQGVTTFVAGNCGISLAPLTLRQAPPPPLDLIGDERDYAFPCFADYLDALDAHATALNAACLVGHSSLRVGTMSELDRAARADEIAAMAERLQEALDAGAIGLSTGLFYAPANAAPAAEIEATVVEAVREHLDPSVPIDDRSLVDTHVARVEVRPEQLVIQLAEARDLAGTALHVPWHKTPPRRRREILLPACVAREHARPIRSETRATLLASIGRGRRWLAELMQDPAASAESIAKREGCTARKVNMTVSLAFLELEPIWRPLAVLMLLVLVQVVTNNLVEPRLTAQAVDLSPLVVLVALAFWTLCWGVVGMVLAVPLTVMLKIVWENVALTRPRARLMAEG